MTRMSRRDLIGRGTLLTTGAALLVACGVQQPPAAAPTPAPKTVPTAGAPAAPATTAVPAAAAEKPTTVAPAATAPPAAAKPAAPAVAEKPGRHLIGKLEGPTVVTDASQLPKAFKEAPMLSELVRAGKLPPVEQRLPQEPLVLKPLHAAGKYGGTWRRGFTGPADYENGNRICSSDKLLFCDFVGTKTMPSVAKGWQASDDGKTFTLFLRKGLKWSDGAPFTADDIMFWYQDLMLNKDLVRFAPAQFQINGKPGRIEKVDDFTVRYVFPEPYFLFEEILRGDTPIGSGQATGQSPQQGYFMGGYAPAHYLKQFHAGHADKAELDTKAAEGNFDNWVGLLRSKSNWTLNPELPVLTPWKTTNSITTPSWSLERNPYYWAVDTDGNQLPYLDKLQFTLAENLEVLNLRAIAGEYDVQDRHVDIAKLPILLENHTKYDYKVQIDPTAFGTEAAIYFNLAYEPDPEIGKWTGNRDFRRALSLGIDRDQLNETFWLGMGTPGSAVVPEDSPYSPGPEYRKLWSTYDLKMANEMLDKVGLDKKDAEGYRLRSDGKDRLRLEVATISAQFLPITQIMEMVRDHWRKIGIDLNVKETERSLLFSRRGNGDLMMEALPWGNTGSEVTLVSPGNVLPIALDTSFGPAYGRWYLTNGAEGKQPAEPEMVQAMDLLRKAPGLPASERVKAAQEIWRRAIDAQWSIGLVGQGGAVMGVRVVKNTLGNVPERFGTIRDTRQPGAAHPEMFYFKS
jgi:peptide/nickel transport system substrate-binding protein